MTDSWQSLKNLGARLIGKDGSSGAYQSFGVSQEIQRSDQMHMNDVFRSKYLKASDLKGDTRVTIKAYRTEKFKNKQGGEETKLVLMFDDGTELVCNKVNARQIAKKYGGDLDEWVLKQITLYPTETEFGGDMVDCIRVRGPKTEMNDDVPF